MLSGKRIILGVTGGIAAYKAVNLLRDYQKAGAQVRVTMTPDARRFVGVETFAALSNHAVAVEVFSDNQASDSWTQHISWGSWADLFVVAPCTANTLAKIAHGISDNMLTSTLLAARSPVLICPTMDGEMYEAPAVQQNLEMITDFGYQLLEPEEGYLASGLEGKGRLPDSEDILEESKNIIEQSFSDGPLSGKKVIVTAGPTREHIDPVRFLSNPSSGKMGISMAKAAQRMGADVTLIHGAVSVEIPDNMHAIAIESTAELFEEVKAQADADVVIMAAAVSDFKPSSYNEQKTKKDAAKSSIDLDRTTDILEWLGSQDQPDQTLIGFAMETENLLENARAKLNKKNADWIIANSLNGENGGFESDSNSVTLLSSGSEDDFSGKKQTVATQVLEAIFG